MIVISIVKPDEKLFAIQDKQKDNILICSINVILNSISIKNIKLGE